MSGKGVISDMPNATREWTRGRSEVEKLCDGTSKSRTILDLAISNWHQFAGMFSSVISGHRVRWIVLCEQ